MIAAAALTVACGLVSWRWSSIESARSILDMEDAAKEAGAAAAAGWE